MWGVVASLLTACPTVTVLATSRVPLNYRPRKSSPSRPWVAEPSGQIRSTVMQPLSFLDRTTLVAGGYALTEHNARTLGEICDMLHGLPLAIELAASWIPVLSPRDLLEHLRQADTALASDTALVEERHRSLAMILDSSWRWLSAGAYGAERVGNLRRRFHPRRRRRWPEPASACSPHWQSGR